MKKLCALFLTLLLLLPLITALPIAGAAIAKDQFEFGSAANVKDFVAENGTVSHKDGQLIFTVTGAGATLSSPNIVVAKGHQYSALLTVRNTIFLRLKNDTDATKLKVYFTSTTRKNYDENKMVEIDVEPHSDYQSYFVNLSYAKQVSGYLRSFRIEPVGATSGEIAIDAVTFEREAPAYDYAGTVESCTADGSTVTVKGTLKPEYAGKTVTLYETQVENYLNELIATEAVATAKANGTSFTITVPYMNGKMTRLSSLFLVGVDNVRVSDRFYIENYEDFTDNPYAFTLPDYSVKVTDAPFNAKGDAFTDDTKAIQAAIDHVSAKGGGVVILPGDNSQYGRRYVATNVKLKDNVEFRIETGAILWQSSRASEYDYKIARGHDVTIPGVNWTHACSCHNYPLIQGDNVKNVKITGGGTLRLVDTGSEELSGGAQTETLWTGCDDRIHIIPVGLWRCENIEVSNVNLRRGNNYHMNFRTCKNIYVSNITIMEVTCASGDGFSATVGTSNMVVDRCFFYSNDDAVTICSTYNDPRGLAWWKANPGGDNCMANLTVRHSNLNGGHGITFITWGTDGPDLELQEIKNITVYDCVLKGMHSAVGSWADNPYHGGTYDGTDLSDASPLKNVLLYNNKYRARTGLDGVKGTNILTDCGIRGESTFQNAKFERESRLQSEKNWVSGLSWWSHEGTVDTEGTPNASYGTLTGDSKLYQGLWMAAGEHTMRMETRFTEGKAFLYAADARTGEIVAEVEIAPSEDFQKQTLAFTAPKSAVLHLGVRHEGAGKMAIDNANVTNPKPKKTTYFTDDFESGDTFQMTNEGFQFLTDESGNTAIGTGEGHSGMAKIAAEHQYKNFDLTFRVFYQSNNSEIDSGIGISALRADGNNQYDLQYKPLKEKLEVKVYQNGQRQDVRSKNFEFPTNRWVTVGLRIQNGNAEWFIDGESMIKFKANAIPAGQIMLFTYDTTLRIDDVTIAEAGTLDMTAVIETEAPATQAPETQAPETTPPTQATETEPVTEAATETEAPATETEAPATETEAPATETEAPATETEAPATETEAPATETEAPATETEAPATETEPATEADPPAETTPAPADDGKSFPTALVVGIVAVLAAAAVLAFGIKKKK